ncbi:hypothetical protein DGo_CA2360 [Deinococcus gobiensis I-0]|uniref:Uncharacterized protein n=1 Tax=Deinococcus gobiensis (strain DSM 21396 / JCM 16679 / CGMCC 1.7299 / I-0) TaxID=745776 RepID=H8GZX5_DEIGI|nr:hypothetical protein DGo_CA2360 [Deinococcus gobiensis I-0]
MGTQHENLQGTAARGTGPPATSAAGRKRFDIGLELAQTLMSTS